MEWEVVGRVRERGGWTEAGETAAEEAKQGFEKLWAGGHLNEMYVRDVKCDRRKKRNEKISRLEGNLNYDNDVYTLHTIL